MKIKIIIISIIVIILGGGAVWYFNPGGILGSWGYGGKRIIAQGVYYTVGSKEYQTYAECMKNAVIDNKLKLVVAESNFYVDYKDSTPLNGLRQLGTRLLYGPSFSKVAVGGNIFSSGNGQIVRLKVSTYGQGFGDATSGCSQVATMEIFDPRDNQLLSSVEIKSEQ
jgi:hypothetical protein